MIAAVGLCSLDVPNLAQLKTRNKAEWLIGGYDLNVETLDAIKAGVAQVTVGQQPYLQGYLPIMALVQHFVEGKELPKGWIDVGTEVVTADNVDLLYERESDAAAMTKIYADAIADNFSGDLADMAKPLPSR
jgi:simple sugar transport system substrate-binding protein